MTLRYPDTLPRAQADSLGYQGANYTDALDVLQGPTRVRLARRNAGGQYQMTWWFSASQAQAFEDWYYQAIVEHDGEIYLPWIGHGIVLAFVNEYDQQPIGFGWSVSATLAQLRVDQSLCDAHIVEVFGNLLRDPLNVADIIRDDGASSVIWRDEFDLATIAAEVC